MPGSFDEENCPKCLAEDGTCQILKVNIGHEQCTYSCSRCGERFTHEELELLYGTAPIS